MAAELDNRRLSTMSVATLKLIYHTAKVRLGFLITVCAVTGIVVIPGHELAP